jgi:23S rRNA (cytosine1962-C5)-methyltransferase
MEKLKPLWLPALVQVLAPKNVIFRDDAPAREKEGLPLAVSAPIGKLPDEMTVIENGLSFSCSPGAGQKTGWFFDHRANRQFVAKQCKGKSVLDLYCYSGGFGILAATHGAAAVTLVDSSQSALDLAQKAANNNPIGNCQLDFVKENVFSILETLKENAQSFDLVLADPPAFVKQLQNKGAGLRGYQKLAKQASFLVAPKGKLFIASCSHHANAADFRQMVEAGIAKAGRQATLLYKGGADKDHPVHPLLPETHYLKSLMYQLD